MELALNLTTLRYLSTEAASGRPLRALLIANEYASANPLMVRSLHKRAEEHLERSRYSQSLLEMVKRGAVFADLTMEDQAELLALEKPTSTRSRDFVFSGSRRAPIQGRRRSPRDIARRGVRSGNTRAQIA